MIYIECYADELLIEILGISSKNIEHSHGKGNVCKKLKSKRNSVGMVDADPQTEGPRYIKTLDFVEAKDDITVLYDAKLHNNVVVINPYLEAWLVKAAKNSNINLLQYNLDENPTKFKKVVNTDLRKLRSLLEDIKDTSSMLQTLKKILLSKQK